MTIALSTAWHVRDDPRLVTTLGAIESMGFQAVELGVSRPRFRRKKVARFLKSSALRVVSVHNVCTEGKPDGANERGDWLASPQPEQRRKGVEATLETIDHARELGAQAVVLHLGALPIDERWDKQELLYRLGRNTGAAAELGVTADELLAERRELAPRYLDAAVHSLDELLEKSQGVRLGIECRMGWHELPSLAELDVLLERFPDPRIGYWHDVGHAVLQQAMGLAGQYEWLQHHGDRTIGIHLHDVDGRLRDHYPPGLGTVDFDPLLELLPGDALRVIEVSSRFIAEEIVVGRRHLEELGF